MIAADSPLEIRYVLFCDDIRIEINGKSIFVGVYTDDIAVPAFPALLNLTFWLDIVANSVEAHKLAISVKLAISGQEAVRLESTLKAPAIKARSSISFEGVGIQLQNPDEIVVSYSVDGGEWIEAARKRVMQTSAS